MSKRIIAIIAGLALVAMVASAPSAQALTAAELQAQIDLLLAQLATLQTQLGTLQGGTTTTGGVSCTITSFTRNLSQGMTGDDVKCLQVVLNSSADTQVAASGTGSAGNETTYFGSLTKAAVVKFQQKYASEVLTPLGLTAGTGYVGSATRTKLNSLLSTTGGTGGTGGTVIPPTGQSVNVTLSSMTPVASTVPANATAAAANVAITKVDLTAGSSDVTITTLKVTRTGLSQDAAISAVKLFDGATQVGTSQSLNSLHQATFSNISIVIPARTTKTITLAATMAASASYNGNIIQLGIASASDITSSATVSGTFPIYGNGATLTSGVTIGTATLYNGALGDRNATDLTVNPTDTDVRFTQVKIMAGSREGLKLTQVTAVKNGTAASSDVKDIRLVNDTTGATLASVSSLDGSGRAVFSNLNLTIAKGGYVELSVIATMNNSGSGRTIAFDLHDGVAYTISIVGESYGFGITPTRNDFCAAAGTCTAQTINQGYLTAQKSSSTPATGYIALGGTGVVLAAFDLTAGGEAINVTQTILTLTPSSGGAAADYTNIVGYDANNNILFGPIDGSTATANTAEDITFTDAYTVPVGTTVVYVKANVSSSAVAGEKAKIGLKANGITAKGSNSGKTTYTTSAGSTVPPSSAVDGNVQTILGPGLKVITAAVPVAGNIVVGAQNVAFAYIDLDASASGEDVKVSTVMVQDTLGSGSTYTGVNNLEVWGDSDNTDSTVQNIKLETTNSTATNGSTVTFSMKSPIKIQAGTITRLTLKADVAATTGTSHTYAVDGTNATVTATGWSTGTGITETYSGAGQAQTVQSSGLLKIEVAADRAAAAQFVAGTTGNSMMSYKLSAQYEDIDVTDLYIATTGSTASGDIAAVKLYLDGVQIGATSGYSLDAGGDAYISFASGTIIVPKDGNKTLTVKVDLSSKANLTNAATLEIGLGDADGDDSDWGADGAESSTGCSYLITATGRDSGATITATTINSTANATTGKVAASKVMYLYDGVLVASLAAGSPSGTQTAGNGKQVLKLDLQAVGDDITINEMEFTFAGTCDPTGTGTIYLKSSDLNTTYADVTSAQCNTYGGSTACLDLSALSIGDSSNADTFSTTLTIAAGTTKSVVLIGDTTGCTATEVWQASCAAPSSSNTTVAGIEWENVAGNDVDSALTKNLPVSGGSLSY